MSNLTTARALLLSKGFTGSLSFLDNAWDPTDAPANSTIFGNPNTNAVTDDIVFGNAAGGNNLFGGKGNDILDGGAGGDNLIGGDGIDWASYATASAGVVADLGRPSQNTGDAAGDFYSSIENLMGSAFGDSLWGDNGDNTISGLNGNDHLNGGNGGNDTLNGDAGMDFLYAGSGRDTLNGGADNDFLYGDGGDTLNGDGGNDTFFYGSKADTMNGGSGDDTFFGDYVPAATVGAGTWQLNGGDGLDTFYAGAGAEAFNGGTNTGGFDTVSYIYADAAVEIDLQAGLGRGDAAGDTYVGIEWVNGSRFGDTFTGSTRAEVFNGGGGNDHFTGGGNNDSYVFDIGFRMTPPVEGMTPHLVKMNIGNDVIHDYDIQASASDANFDAIFFTGITQDQFSQINATQVGADTVLTSNLFDGSITILNTDAHFWHQI